MAAAYKITRFRAPQGYVIPSESQEVRRSLPTKHFLELLISKLETTLTMESKETGSVNLLKLYFTERESWFTVELIIKKSQSLIYGESLLAQKFLKSLTAFVADSSCIIISSLGNVNVICDFLATTLKPFFNPNAVSQYLEKAPGLVKVLWESYQNILKIHLGDINTFSRFRPVVNYMFPSGFVEQRTVKLFDKEFQWPRENVASKISQLSLQHLAYISPHIKYFLLEIGSQLGTYLKVESIDEISKRAIDQKHTKLIMISFNSWQWLTSYSLYLDVDKICSFKSQKRKLKLFESELIIGLYHALLERLVVPSAIKNELNMTSKERIHFLVEDITSLMKKTQTSEFECPKNPWEAKEWKDTMGKFWSDIKQTDSVISKEEIRSAPLIVQNRESEGEEEDDEKTSDDLEELPEINHNVVDTDVGKIGTDIFLAGDFAGCTIVLNEINTSIQTNECYRLFVNEVLKEFDAKLCITVDKGKYKSIHIVIKKEDKSFFHSEIPLELTNNGGIVDTALNHFMAVLKEKLVISGTECVSLCMGQKATQKMVTAVVNHFCELFNF